MICKKGFAGFSLTGKLSIVSLATGFWATNQTWQRTLRPLQLSSTALVSRLPQTSALLSLWALAGWHPRRTLPAWTPSPPTGQGQSSQGRWPSPLGWRRRGRRGAGPSQPADTGSEWSNCETSSDGRPEPGTGGQDVNLATRQGQANSRRTIKCCLPLWTPVRPCPLVFADRKRGHPYRLPPLVSVCVCRDTSPPGRADVRRSRCPSQCRQDWQPTRDDGRQWKDHSPEPRWTDPAQNSSVSAEQVHYPVIS